jgi:uncharacterized Tic20 family protein
MVLDLRHRRGGGLFHPPKPDDLDVNLGDHAVNLADQLEKLEQLRRSGAITDDEFAKAKARLLDGTRWGDVESFFGSDVDQQTRRWAMLLHLSQLANFALPTAGLVLTILIWQIKKSELPVIDAHGKVVLNWLISALIYGVACVILHFALIGWPLMMVLGILAVVFPIIGAVKANNGELWKYPLSITFLK